MGLEAMSGPCITFRLPYLFYDEDLIYLVTRQAEAVGAGESSSFLTLPEKLVFCSSACFYNLQWMRGLKRQNAPAVNLQK